MQFIEDLVAVLFIVSIAIPANAGEGSKGVPLERLSAVEIPRQFQGYPAVILLEEDRMEISGRSAIHEMRLVKKLLKPGLPEECAFRFETADGRKIRKIEGRAIHPDGRETVIEAKDIVVLPDFAEFVLYSDRKSHAFRFPGAGTGTVMEVTVTWKLDDLTLWAPAPFQGELPVLERRYVLIHPTGFDFVVHGSCMSSAADEEADLGGAKRILVWERRDIEPLRREPLMPPTMEVIPALWFSARGETELGVPMNLDSWGGIADWYERLCAKSLEPGRRLAATMDSLRLVGRSDREKASLLFAWVRDNLRYVAIYLGDEGYRPHRVEDILANRYGDCKDQAVVLVAALRKAGVEARLVLVRTADLGSIPDILPLPYYFNHVIVASSINGEIVYLDPTCDTCGFGVLPAMDQGAAALVVASGAGGLTALPSGGAAPNRFAVSLGASISGSGDARVRVSMKLEGVYAARARSSLASRANTPKAQAAGALIEDVMPAMRVDETTVAGEHPDSIALTITAVGTMPSLLDTAATYPLIRAVVVPLSIDLPECSRRVHPIELPPPRILEYDVSVIVPDGWSIRETPPSGTVRGEGFEYECSGSIEGRTARFARVWKITESRLPADRCAEVRSRLETILDFEGAHFLAGRP